MSNDSLIGLESLFLNGDLSAEEFFALVISSCENDLQPAKHCILNTLPKVSGNDSEYVKLKAQFDEMFPAKIHHESKNVCTESKSTEPAKKAKNRKKKSSEPTPVILWFRRDLRIYDNPALNRAAKDEHEKEREVIPLFIWSEDEEKERMNNGGAVKVWLRQALKELDESLKENYKSRLIYRSAKTSSEALMSIVKETGAKTVVWTALYEPWIQENDAKIVSRLKSNGVTPVIEHSYLLHRPDEIIVSEPTRGLGSVTHFMECCKENTGSRMQIGTPVEPPRILKRPQEWPNSLSLEELKLYVKPKRRNGTCVDWAQRIHENWNFGENGGYNQLCHFLEEDVVHYEKESSRADMPWTSVISPYLHFGQISPRTVLHEALSRGRDAAKFRRKLAWRDMSYWILTMFPCMDTKPIRPQYSLQWWSQDPNHLKAWQKGQTGYPLVDAAMRQLWAIGWMNNYMRHVVASFLISYLRISWVEGYKWFQDTLLDADVAINAMMWQNGGMSGLDQWNFVMHPIDAAQTCDPKGNFVRKWIPQLSQVPERYIHCPWKCPSALLKRSGVSLGHNYPHRIIENLDEARENSLKDVSKLRQESPNHIDPHSGRDFIRISSKTLKMPNATGTQLNVPLITRREFIYRTIYPDAQDNPYTAVLKGYVSRRRDEEIERMQKVDFASGILLEEVNRYKKENDIVDDKVKKGRNRFKHKLDGRNS